MGSQYFWEEGDPKGIGLYGSRTGSKIEAAFVDTWVDSPVSRCNARTSCGADFASSKNASDQQKKIPAIFAHATKFESNREVRQAEAVPYSPLKLER